MPAYVRTSYDWDSHYCDEEGLVTPKVKGKIRMEAPAGLVEIEYHQESSGKVWSLKLTNVGAFLYKKI